jgi:MarR family transcriptional regulator, lower aerobic nicotinate degradation pathway regulator
MEAESTDLSLPAGVERRLSMLVSRLGNEVRMRAADGLAELGLDGRGYVTLAVLADDQPRSQQELARMIGKVPGLVVTVIDELEEGGFVARRRSGEDRRRTIVELTERGRTALAEADRLAARVEDELFAALGAEQRAAFRDALLQVTRTAWRPAGC